MKFNIPKHVQMIMKRLQGKGFEAYIVGGSIRDMLLGKIPNDYDITTDALPQQIESIFSDLKTIDIGKKFGTIIVVQSEGNVEVTSFRMDGAYIDGRKPEWVSFSHRIEEDLSRRDFTINAIAYNHTKGIVDPYGGRVDLAKGIIRTVGCPKVRFGEDYLRILRAVRFSTQLGFVIEKETFNAGKRYGVNISKVSVERIIEELFKILLSDKPSNGIRLLERMEILKIILPEIIPSIDFQQRNPHHVKDVYGHILCVLDNSPPILQVRLAALFHDIGKPHTLTIDEDGVGHFYGHNRLSANISKDILKRYRLSNELINKVYILVKEHMNHHDQFKDKGLKRLIRRLGDEEVFNLIALQKADIQCSNRCASIDHILERENRLRDILEEEVYDIDQMDIRGDDLIDLGFEQGKIIGDILEYLLDLIMERPELNKKRILKEKALEKFSNSLEHP